MTVFETETMAELCVKQGLVTEALAIYRRLVADAPDDVSRARRAARLAELERIARGVAEARGSAAAAPVATPARSDGPGQPWLTLERRDDALIFSWSLPPGTPGPALQLLLLRRGADGIETETRTVLLDGVRGRTTITAPGLYAVRAAAGRMEGERFVPLARLQAPGP
jgi:hypothetical protein